MEQRGRADAVGPGLERNAARGLSLFKLLDAREVPIVPHAVGQEPGCSAGCSSGE
jgi:hypothetical protein